MIADFDGDGISDVARATGNAWQYSRNARSGWSRLRATSEPLIGKPVGRFDRNSTADVIVWNRLLFDYAPGGHNPVRRWSRQIMR